MPIVVSHSELLVCVVNIDIILTSNLTAIRTSPEPPPELQLELEKVNIKAHPKKPLNPAWIESLAIADKTELLKTIYTHIVQLDAVTYRKYGFDSNIFLSRDFAHSFQQSYLEDTVFYKGAKVPTYLLVKHLPSGAPLVTVVSAEEAEFFIKSTKKPDANVVDIHLQNYKGEVLAGDPPYNWDESVHNVRIMEQVNYFRGDISAIGRLVTQDKLSWLRKDGLRKLNALKEITVFRKTNAANLQWLINKVQLALEKKPSQDSRLQLAYENHKEENFLGVIGRYYNWYIYYSLTNFNLYYLQQLHYLQVKALYIFIDIIIKIVTKSLSYIKTCV